ncbi:carbohydrate ABC transporter permease [Natrialbaceae archaeon A-CW2]|uniref:carbohydrate ABC transporter permease n=1 Tax=Natronosalvus amylolyticus TaxID=2961994 RepID=UPI0020C9F4C2|nr:carbohydrate ABC transporter permease [Natronosalvus amylolyticus]
MDRGALKRMDASDVVFKTIQYVVLVVSLLVVVVPILYVISVSFRPQSEVYTATFQWLPQEPTIQPWVDAYDMLSEELFNSFLIATGTAVLSLLITIPGAYVFGRMDFPGKQPLFYGIVLALLFPYILLIIPIADIWATLGLYNTLPGMWLAYQVFVTPFALWILRDFFEELPENLEESAQVYGCTQFGAFLRVVLPLSMPAIAAVGFLAFLTGWNDFLFSNMLTTGTGPRPAVVQLFLSTGAGGTLEWPIFMAQTLIIGLPPAVLYLIANKQLSSAFNV